MQKEAAMNKDEILEKSRRDNDGMDERFKLCLLYTSRCV